MPLLTSIPFEEKSIKFRPQFLGRIEKLKKEVLWCGASGSKGGEAWEGGLLCRRLLV
jgi:hypothetical protein